MDERVEIEGDAALNEEDRDQEAESDRLELAGDRLAVLPLDEEAYDDAGGEGPEQDVEAQLVGMYTSRITRRTEIRTGNCAVE